MAVATEGVYTPITPEPADQFRDRNDRKRLWRGIANSLLLHGLILALLIGLWRIPPAQEVVFPPVTIKFEGTGGASGSPGGSGGAARLPGERNAATQRNASAPARASPSDTVPLASDTAPPLPPPKPAQTVVKLRDTTPPKPRQHKSVSHPRVVKPTAAPAPQPAPEPAPEVTATPTPAPAQPAPATELATTGNPAAIGTGMEGVGSAGNGNFGVSQGAGGPGRGTGTADDYLDRVRRHLERYKRYPDDALKKKQEGTVIVAFTLAHDGTVTGAWITRSSGNPLLDQAALAMLHDGSPVPPVPQRYWGRTAPITMPVDFNIGFFDRLLR
ncbi:MAG: energy transducer TonB [Alphaproteobacteria bacterium]|nr:energy transducer TonB [Alphaproteobacteria bacterium]